MSRLFLLLWAGLALAPVLAHEMRPTIVDLDLAEDGAFELRIQTNLEARMAGIAPDHANTDDAPEADQYNRFRALSPRQLSEAFGEFEPSLRQGLVLEADGKRQTLEFIATQVPDEPDARLARNTTLTYRGHLRAGSDQLVWRFKPEFGASVLRISWPDQPQPTSHWLQPGDVSPPFSVTGLVAEPTLTEVWGQYLMLGFEHILPLGLDHILFVLGLFLLSTNWRPLLWQVSAFTLAHTLTLGLTIHGVVSLPSSIVEPLIALSIAYVAIENLFTRRLHVWRPILVFAFGLLHGMGFANVLVELGLPEGRLLSALISFNLGVELGQLAVITLAFLLVWPLRSRSERYRRWVVVPVSALIALTGLYWTWERIWG